MSGKPLYHVLVKHNIVCAIERIEDGDDSKVPQTKLEVSTQLAKNNLENGCIDGDYYFDDANLAKNFALLSLDFVKRLIDKTVEKIEDRSFNGEFDWSDRHPKQ